VSWNIVYAPFGTGTMITPSTAAMQLAGPAPGVLLGQSYNLSPVTGGVVLAGQSAQWSIGSGGNIAAMPQTGAVTHAGQPATAAISGQGFAIQRTGVVYGDLQTAFANAISNDIILVDDGSWTVPADISASFTQSNLTVQRRNPATRPILNVGVPTKGTFNRQGSAGAGTFTLDGLQIIGSSTPGNNNSLNSGSVWVESHSGVFNLIIQNCVIRNLGTGILVGNFANDTFQLYDTEISGCGTVGDGSTHNVYVGTIASFTARGVYSHDCADGHLMKSRAAVNNIQACRLDSGTLANSRELDLPNGSGVASVSTVYGNTIIKRANSLQSNMVGVGLEYNLAGSIDFQQNTMVNYRNPGLFFQYGSNTVHTSNSDNVFCGPNAPAIAGNYIVAIEAFMNEPAGDYSLQYPIYGGAVSAAYEYVSPSSHKARTDAMAGAVNTATVVPTWVSNQLGSTPTLNRFCTVNAANPFSSIDSTLLENASPSSWFGTYGPALTCRARDSMLLCTAGGHAATNNNIVIGDQLEIAVPVMFEAGLRTPIGQRTQNATYGPSCYSDSYASPASVHAYAMDVFNDHNNRFFLVREGFNAFSSGGGDGTHNDVRGLQPGAPGTPGTWDARTTYPDVPNLGVNPGDFGNESPACVDPATGNMFSLSSNYGLYMWTRATNTWGRVNTVGDGALGMVYDNRRRRIVLFSDFYSGASAPRYALESEGYATWHTMSVTGTPGGWNGVWSGVYDPWNDCMWLITNYSNYAAWYKLSFTDGSGTSGGSFASAGFTATGAFDASNLGSSGWQVAAMVVRLRGIAQYSGWGGGYYFVKTS